MEQEEKPYEEWTERELKDELETKRAHTVALQHEIARLEQDYALQKEMINAPDSVLKNQDSELLTELERAKGAVGDLLRLFSAFEVRQQQMCKQHGLVDEREEEEK